MNPGLVIKLRPTGPWRAGPDNGARDEVDAVYHSDTLYSAVTWAMQRLGHFDAWLDATARNPAGSAVGFSSLYPYLDDIGFIAPPRTAWPPDSVSGKVRWKGARRWWSRLAQVARSSACRSQLRAVHTRRSRSKSKSRRPALSTPLKAACSANTSAALRHANDSPQPMRRASSSMSHQSARAAPGAGS